MNPRRWYLNNDWYPGGIPSNVRLGEDVYLDSSYAFAAFHSLADPGLVLGHATGAYDRASFVVGPRGRIEVGAYTCLNGTYLICHERITIGAHCFLSWGVVITDNTAQESGGLAERRAALCQAASTPDRIYPQMGPTRPVVLEDNVWVGFDAVILPGTRLGQGCIVGCKSVIRESVPAYHVVAGNPPRKVRELDPDDTPEARSLAIREFGRGRR